LAVAAVGGSIAAATLQHSSPAAPTGMVRCYSLDRTSVDSHQYTDTSMAAAAGTSATDPSGTVTAAIEACSALWQIGLVQPGAIVPEAAASQTTHTVPDLVACVLPGGQAAVFPGDTQTCHRLGLPRLADRG
jgi:hypothetical protein